MATTPTTGKQKGKDAGPQLAFEKPKEIDYSKKRFLIVDAVKDMRTNMNVTLASFGVNKVDYAGKVLEAITMIKRADYDVLMADYDLGHGYDGIHFLGELRHRNLLKPSAIFMIVTGERRLANVISAAELAPDAYLLKPFTGQDVKVRLDRAYRKKNEFSALDAAILQGDYFKALSECNERLSRRDPFSLDFLKMKGQIALTIGDYALARGAFEAAVEKKGSAWAKLGLAKALFHLNELKGARHLLDELVSSNKKMMEAYDLIARIHIVEQDFPQAQEVLKQASQMSLGNVARFKQLGEVALKNGDFETAIKSFGQTIVLAKHSFWRDAADYSYLAKAHLAADNPLEAVKIAEELRREFRYDNQAEMLANVVETQVSYKQGNANRAAESLAKAMAQFAANTGELPDHFALELAEACYQVGEQDSGSEIVNKLLSNHHEDHELLARVATLYQNIGQPDLGQQLIEQTAKRIVEINNQAVHMAQSGDLEGAVQQFIKAVEEMPANAQILLNAVNAMLAFVGKLGWHQGHMDLAQTYLDRARALEPTSVKYLKLREAFQTAKRKFREG